MKQKIPWKHRSDKMPLSEEKKEQEISEEEESAEKAGQKAEEESETDTEPEQKKEPEINTEAEKAAGPETEVEAEAEKEAGSETEVEAEAEKEAEAEIDTEEELEAEAEPETKSAKKMHVPGLVLNAVFLILNGFALAMIICLFLMQPHPGENVKPTLDRFTTNAQDYYKDGETYHQVNANVKSYHSSGSTKSAD